MKVIVYTEDSKILFEGESSTIEEAQALGNGVVAAIADANYFVIEGEFLEELRELTDADFFWHYRIIGYTSQGSVAGSLIVGECDNPPTAQQLKSIETTHEHVLRYPGVVDAYTVGPVRSKRRV